MGVWSASPNYRFAPAEWAPGTQWMRLGGPNRRPEDVEKDRNLECLLGNEAPVRNLVAI